MPRVGAERIMRWVPKRDGHVRAKNIFTCQPLLISVCDRSGERTVVPCPWWSLHTLHKQYSSRQYNFELANQRDLSTAVDKEQES